MSPRQPPRWRREAEPKDRDRRGEADAGHRLREPGVCPGLPRARGLAGATAWKGFAGFGANSRLHTTKVLRLSEDLPIVVEIVDAADKIAAFLPVIDGMVTEGLVTVERAEVILYRASKKA